MGKSSSPSTPDYTKAAIATSNSSKYNESTPAGNVTWTLREGADPNNPQAGDYVRTTTLSPDQQTLYDQTTTNKTNLGDYASSLMGSLGSDDEARQKLQDSLYNRATQYYDQNFGDQESALRSQLLNSGLTEGSEAYDKAMRNFGQVKNSAYSTAADTATINAEQQSQTNQNNAMNRLIQALGSSSYTTPSSANSSGGSGTDYSSAAANTYNTNLAASNASNSNLYSSLGLAGQLGSMLFNISDRRLKSDIERVGTGYKGLPVYEYTIFGKRQRGYMADEVEAVDPTAVATHSSGYKMVDYGKLGGML